ncbi:ferredoxin--NADP reductase [Pseudoxanthomonas japonensis]|jgi:ferredoxin--NADP+ reductase|nr:ferredoxin--NADP reductase [Pseudoxanthomonas japonensis]
MSLHAIERVTHVHHWNDSLFSFRTTRDPGLRFESGHFVMIGLEVDGRPLMRAYSIASPHWEEHLEFFSIKVQDGQLTSRLQHLQVGDPVLVSRKPTGTLVLHDLHPGRHLYLLGTGTGLAPFMSIIQDPETYERYEKVIVAHGVRHISDLAYSAFIERDLPAHPFLGAQIRQKLLYHPTVTRDAFRNTGRLTAQIADGRLADASGLPPLHPARDRFMICGSPSMLAEIRALLDQRGFQVSPRTGHPGDYVFERAFVEK